MDNCACPFNNSPKDSREETKQQLKNRLERGNSDVARFRYKVTVLFFFLTLYESSKHLQDAFLPKLLGQFIGLHNTQFFKILETFT